MNFSRLKQELGFPTHDSALAAMAGDWLNDAVLELAADFELPKLKLKEATTLTVTETDWLYDLPATYHKKLFKVRDSNGDKVSIFKDIDVIDDEDYDHDDTGDHVTMVAFEDSKIAIYPKAAEDLPLWFYRLPVDMSVDGDTPDGIPAAYHERVLLAKVIIKNFRLLMDMAVDMPHKSLDYWQKRYQEGLYSNSYGDIGMINFFAKNKRIKRHGGRNPLP